MKEKICWITAGKQCNMKTQYIDVSIWRDWHLRGRGDIGKLWLQKFYVNSKGKYEFLIETLDNKFVPIAIDYIDSPLMDNSETWCDLFNEDSYIKQILMKNKINLSIAIRSNVNAKLIMIYQ